MTGRERVRRCVEFDHPDRPPRDLWMLPIARLQHDAKALAAFEARWPRDFTSPAVSMPKLKAMVKGDRHAVGQFTDEWGCVWENLQAGVIGEVKHPLIDDWARLDRLRPPVEALDFSVAQVNQSCAGTDDFVLGGGVNPFERCQHLRGPENLYMDLAEEPAELDHLMHTVHQFNLDLMQAWARTDVDALLISDDWGSQRALLISPHQWRRRFKQLYRDYVRIAHDAGKKLFMHSDGYIFDIYEDLVEIGVDAINSQLFCMDIEAIGRQFAGRLTFWGEIDRQWVLPQGTTADARAAVARVIEHLYRPEGGVVAQFEFGAAARLENAQAVFQAWHDLVG